ncbi:MAG: hypothetical protein GEV28_34465 [Actinophytocola sp.]|uniref:hypothetical protein n=1 Tax=Actinophytocola sp. TaxID=1872138 RepID=UPI0013250C8F|nr:hypothetical protein [Actinophytocola sp.]MPZ85220.1 hypothetical protein [Actinophytocola sp.]
MGEFDTALETASTVGASGVLAIIAWQMLRMLCFLAFVLIMCQVQGRTTGSYPTLAEAARALRELMTK